MRVTCTTPLKHKIKKKIIPLSLSHNNNNTKKKKKKSAKEVLLFSKVKKNHWYCYSYKVEFQYKESKEIIKQRKKTSCTNYYYVLYDKVIYSNATQLKRYRLILQKMNSN